MSKNRNEEIKLNIIIKKIPKKLIDEIKKIDSFKLFEHVGEENDLYFNYFFNIEYLDNIEERFRIILKLLKYSTVVKSNFKVLNHKICIIKELIEKINEYEKQKK